MEEADLSHGIPEEEVSGRTGRWGARRVAATAVAAEGEDRTEEQAVEVVDVVAQQGRSDSSQRGLRDWGTSVNKYTRAKGATKQQEPTCLMVWVSNIIATFGA